MIYADANATTPVLPEVLDEMLPWLRQGYANPSGAHTAGKQARAAIERAREQVAAMLGAVPDEVVFTSGGTESVNSALRSLDAHCGPGALVVSAIEHSAVLRCAEHLGREVRLVPVTRGGLLDLAAYEAALDGAAMVSIMASNNETGVIQPLREAAQMARSRGLPMHTDAVQAPGRMPLDARALDVDLLSISAHKFHGPKGVGALYIRRGLKFQPLLWGGGQEGGRRSGGEDHEGVERGEKKQDAREFRELHERK